MKVICVTNRKGGVGKTTVSTHIAAGLARLGLRVGLIDTDSQGHAGLMFGIDGQNGLYEALIGGKSMEEVAVYVPPERYSTSDDPSPGHLWVIPSAELTYRISHELSEDSPFAVFEMCEAFAEHYGLDVIIADTQPSMSKLDGAMWLATDGFIFVTDPGRLSIDGVEKALIQLANFTQTRRKYLQRKTDILGIIPNKFATGLTAPRLSKRNLLVLREQFQQYVWEPIPRSVVWEEIVNDFNNPELVYTYAPASKEAQIAQALAVKTWKLINAEVTQS